MSITDELREYARAFHDIWLDSTDQTISFTTGDMPPTSGSIRMDTRFLAIADRIDEECERRQEEAIDEVLGGLMKMTDEKMAENGWVRLPKDADGFPIHLGDVMDGVDKYATHGNVTGEVITISYDATQDPRDSTSVAIREWADDRKSYHTVYLDPYARQYCHHHEPTVEDVLRDMLRDAACQLHDDGSCEMGLTYEQFDKYAKMLQLREA